MQSTAKTMKRGVKSVLEPLHNTITLLRARPSSKAFIYFFLFFFTTIPRKSNRIHFLAVSSGNHQAAQ